MVHFPRRSGTKMKHTQHPTLMDSLKEAISEQHARMEAIPFIAALTDGKLPIESYVGLLRAMAVIQGTLDHELAQIDSGTIRDIMLDRPSRLVHLRKDLSIIDGQFVPDIAGAVTQSRRIAERIRLYRVEHPTDLLGILYVLEGTTLGNTVHLNDVLKTVGDKTAGQAHYYTGYGKETSRYWREFSAAMNALPIDQECCRRLITAALDFFDQLEPLFSALYPLDNAVRVYSAGMLNPEAGDHTVPESTEELAAAVAAAKKCREDFPYFDERYRERGRSFAKSDAAWLASLAGLPEVHLVSQVEWLGRVLANRGMPRITLERQLELLYQELSATTPAKIEQYKGLLKAAEKLKAERLNIISEPVFNRLTGEFHLATEGELQRCGDLIVSAVCDQSVGISEAVGSLLPWLTDPERFSPEWISAVAKTLKQAENSVNGNGISLV
jgi:heme oxygenase